MSSDQIQMVKCLRVLVHIEGLHPLPLYHTHCVPQSGTPNDDNNRSQIDSNENSVPLGCISASFFFIRLSTSKVSNSKCSSIPDSSNAAFGSCSRLSITDLKSSSHLSIGMTGGTVATEAYHAIGLVVHF